MTETPEPTEAAFVDVVKRLRNGPHGRWLTNLEDMAYPTENSVFTYFPDWPRPSVDEIWANLVIPRRARAGIKLLGGGHQCAVWEANRAQRPSRHRQVTRPWLCFGVEPQTMNVVDESPAMRGLFVTGGVAELKQLKDSTPAGTQRRANRRRHRAAATATRFSSSSAGPGAGTCSRPRSYSRSGSRSPSGSGSHSRSRSRSRSPYKNVWGPSTPPVRSSRETAPPRLICSLLDTTRHDEDSAATSSHISAF